MDRLLVSMPARYSSSAKTARSNTSSMCPRSLTSRTTKLLSTPLKRQRGRRTNCQAFGSCSVFRVQVPSPLVGEGEKGGKTMDHKQIVTARLAAVGVSLSDDELDQLTTAYASLLKWETVIQGMVEAETEPALIFKAQVEG